MAAKRTADLIPLCHPLPLSSVKVELTPEPEQGSVADLPPHGEGFPGILLAILAAAFFGEGIAALYYPEAARRQRQPARSPYMPAYIVRPDRKDWMEDHMSRYLATNGEDGYFVVPPVVENVNP